MSDLVPIRVRYNFGATAEGEQSYSVGGEIRITELTDIVSLLDNHVNRMSHDLEGLRDAEFYIGVDV